MLDSNSVVSKAFMDMLFLWFKVAFEVPLVASLLLVLMVVVDSFISRISSFLSVVFNGLLMFFLNVEKWLNLVCEDAFVILYDAWDAPLLLGFHSNFILMALRSWGSAFSLVVVEQPLISSLLYMMLMLPWNEVCFLTTRVLTSY